MFRKNIHNYNENLLNKKNNENIEIYLYSNTFVYVIYLLQCVENYYAANFDCKANFVFVDAKQKYDALCA